MDFDLNLWINDIQLALQQFNEMELGVPNGNNSITFADSISDISMFNNNIPRDLQEFYAHIEQISLPDVFNGYFIDSLGNIFRKTQSGWYPSEIMGGTYAGQIMTFGTTGGGDMFAIQSDPLHGILLLPSYGITDKVFDDNMYPSKLIAENFSSFLIRLWGDLNAFVHRTANWDYMKI